MSATYFVQECPTCGRLAQIRVEYLGKQVRCRHCGSTFAAFDPSAAPGIAAPDASSSILARADALLESVTLLRQPEP